MKSALCCVRNAAMDEMSLLYVFSHKKLPFLK